MAEDEVEDQTVYVAVVNQEDQYSIWPAALPVPHGWRDTGVRGTKAACLQYIEETWTDMRPRSLRERLARETGAESPKP